MTDITNQDRRQLRDDAKAVINKTTMRSSAAVSIAQYVLATVEPPAPTLAEELRYRATLLDNGDPDGDAPQALRSLATRAEQMEQDAEERQEWNRNITKQVATLARERDDARAEVERLTAERDGAREEIAWLRNGPGHTEVDTDLPDPADVKPGEAWLIGRPGAPDIGVRNCPHTDFPWTVVEDEGHVRVMDSGIVLRSRLVPAPRVITDAGDLDKLEHRTIIISTDGLADVYQKDSNGEWVDVTTYGCSSRRVIGMEGAVTVLWEPEA